MIGKKKSGFQITSVTSEYDGPRAPIGEADFGARPLLNGGHHPPSSSPPAAAEGPGEGAPRATGGPCASRFRVVKLCQGEPYRRGRWTCLDLYDRDLDGHSLAKALEGGRPHAGSLDSHPEAAVLARRAAGRPPKSQGSPEAPRAKQQPAVTAGTLSTLIQAARTLSLEGPPGNDPPPSPPPGASPLGRGSGTPKEGGEGALGAAEDAKAGPAQPPGNKPGGGESTATASKSQLPSNVKQPSSSSSGEQGAARKFSEPRPTPASPAAPLTQDGIPSRKSRAWDPGVAGGASLRFASPMQTLAKSMLSVGTQPDGDDDSGSSSSMVAIDNKIEQAMDLVKSHLMYAVREEVEVLKEQIKELVDRNSLLERENALLKSLANPEQLGQLQSQLRSAGSSSGSSSTSSNAT